MKNKNGRRSVVDDIERRPEAVGRGRGIPAVGDRDAVRAAGLAERVVPVAQRLSPADGRRVLRADAAAHRQARRPLPPRQIEHDADIAALAHAARRASCSRQAPHRSTGPSVSISGRER